MLSSSYLVLKRGSRDLSLRYSALRWNSQWGRGGDLSLNSKLKLFLTALGLK